MLDMTRAVGTIAELWRFPVKSMQGEQLDSVDVTAAGIVGDRAYAVVDSRSGKVASAKHPRLWPGLLECRATYVGEPRPGAAPQAARIELGDGNVTTTDAPDVDAALSRFFGRDVHLTTAAPEDFTIDEYRPDLENLNPDGEHDVVVQQRLGAAFFDDVGLPSFVPAGALVDLFPLSVLTTSTLARFRALVPDADWDVRRFRMNIIVSGADDGFAENAWVGSSLTMGPDVELLAAIPTPRCVMPTLAQADLPRDPAVLRTIARHNRVDVVDRGLYPCAGVYAVAAHPGQLKTGHDVGFSVPS